MGAIETTVQNHYGIGGILERIDSYLRNTGVDPERLNPEDLFPIDQLHGRGLAATTEHLEASGIRPGMHVLDLGCGVGGASRYIAVNGSCRVTGIDLTPEYVEVARELTRRCGLGDRIDFR
jgi:cyclopropane fatty-acyl-phospholipid synthase-like methyltransferase